MVSSLLFRQQASAGDYPDKPIRLIVGNAPGGATDVIARLVAQYISGPLQQNVIVLNRPGASGGLGAVMVAGAAPDGPDRNRLGLLWVFAAVGLSSSSGTRSVLP